VGFVSHAFGLGLLGGWGFGGFIGAMTFLLAIAPKMLDANSGWWQLLPVTAVLGAILLGYVGYRVKARDGADRDDAVIAAILFGLVGALIGAPPFAFFALFAFLVGPGIGTFPGITLWLIYGLALVLFTGRRYSPTMDVAAFRRDARRLAALTSWLATVPLGLLAYLLLGNPANSGDIPIALALLTGLATLTAPFAWWHSKFLIDWWLADIEKSGAA
jgi:hypothetical protein